MADRGATLNIEIEGRNAFRKGLHASDCPYSFCNTPCYPNKYVKFDVEYRPKLDAWMRGWINEKNVSLKR